MHLQSDAADRGQDQCYVVMGSPFLIKHLGKLNILNPRKHFKIWGMLAECLLDTWIKGPEQILIISYIIPPLLVCANFI
jgi:hypothetical protein